MLSMRLILALTCSLALSGCFVIGDASQPIPTLSAPATKASDERVLIVVLPGFGIDAQDMQKRGVPEAIHQGWPQADVVLTSATFDYFRKGKLVARLHDEVIEPARARYRQVWLAGASMGGMGALLYEREHPREVSGVVLLAPFLGGNGLLDEIRKAGGVSAWNPGPLPAEMSSANYQRQVWKMIKAWGEQPGLADRIWLSCGVNDPLLPDVHLLARVLPATHYLERPGGHWWSFFLPAAQEVFARVREQTEDKNPAKAQKQGRKGAEA
jgi:hypothetical protein